MVVVPGVTILGKVRPEHATILSPDSLAFLATLHRCFENKRQELLEKRRQRQTEINLGVFPDFLPETEHIRNDDTWKAAPPASGLVDRRVEITGPVDRKLVINALNSSATQFMADFEDSTSPTWENVLNGQVNLKDANDRTISYKAPNGKHYRIKDSNLPVLIVRPRGWHLNECHLLVDGVPISASLFDFGLYFFHNAFQTLKIGQGPYFYLPKMESHLEARLWNDVFNLGQDYLKIPRGTIRATVLIETIMAAFEMDEIIYELCEHSAGLNCGRWDYIFSFIKKLQNHQSSILPDRSAVTMTVPFMKAYVDLLIKTCHRRGVHAMGGMAAQIPIKNNHSLNAAAMEKVKKDKTREVLAGHDGTWVAHPDLIPIVLEVFNKHMPQPNQLFTRRDDIKVSGEDLLIPRVELIITKKGVTENCQAALEYITSWLNGAGCVPINNLMEDAATAEIARAQLWQWIRHECVTSDTNERITFPWVKSIVQEIGNGMKKVNGSILNLAVDRLLHLIGSSKFEEFLTLACYPDIMTVELHSKL